MSALLVDVSWWRWFWGTWWPTIDWGNAPAWVGSILTSVSVGLALSLVWVERDRRLNIQAYSTSVRAEVGHAKDRPTLDYVDVFMYNASDMPIIAAAIRIESTHWDHGRRITEVYRTAFTNDFRAVDRTIPSRVQVSNHFDLTAEIEPWSDKSRIDLFFRDINGKVWRKNLRTGKLKAQGDRRVIKGYLLV